MKSYELAAYIENYRSFELSTSLKEWASNEIDATYFDDDKEEVIRIAEEWFAHDFDDRDFETLSADEKEEYEEFLNNLTYNLSNYPGQL